MPAVARFEDLCTGHGCHPPRKNTGSSPDVYANSKLVHRRGDSWGVHVCPPRVLAPHGSVLKSGSKTVFANGKPIGRVNDPVACGSYVAEYPLPNVFVGDSKPPTTPIFEVDINISAEHEEYLREGMSSAAPSNEIMEYGDGGISNGDGQYLSSNTSPVNGIEGPQSAGLDNSNTFERVDDPTLNFLPHTDSRIEPHLKSILLRIAGRWGRTLDITSAYRSPEYNQKVGGAKGSMHQQGKATDIIMSNYNKTDRARFIDIAIEEGIRGVGLYNTFTHIDIGGKRSWGSNGSRTSLPNYPWARTILQKHGYSTS